MKTIRAKTRCAPLAALALVVVFAGTALAGDDGAVSDEATSNSAATDQARASLTDVRARAEAMPIDRRLDIDKRISATVERVNKQAQGKGQSAVAKRLAVEFSTTGDILLDEKADYSWSWGEVMVAHTLLAHSIKKVAVPDLATLRAGGLSWGAIAYGLEFRMEDFEEMLKAEGRVAMGLPKR
jgi:hypothetical protein